MVYGITAILAQGKPPAQITMADWIVQSLGPIGFFMLLVAFVIFLGACVAVAKGKRPEVIASYAAFVPIPFFLGLFAGLKGTIASFSVVAMADVPLKGSEIAEGIAAALLTPTLGLMTMFPSYLVLGIGWLMRLSGSDSTTAPNEEAPLPSTPIRRERAVV